MNKMNKLINIIAVQLILISSMLSQNNTFAHVYNIVDGNEFSEAILYKNNTYFLLNKGVWDPQNQNSKESDFISIIDKNGKIKYIKYFLNSNFWSPKNAIRDINDTLFILGDNSWIDHAVWNLYKTNLQGDSLDFITYSFPEKTVFVEGMANKGEYIYLAGRTWHYDPWHGEDIIVVKSDKKGNVIKENRFYDIANPQYGNVDWDIAKTPDGNFLLAISTMTNKGDQAKLIKFDDELNAIWYRVFNSCDDTNNTPDVTVSADGMILFAWGLDTEDIIDELGVAKFNKYSTWPPTLYGMTPDGDILWADTLWTLRSKGKTYGPEKDIFKMIATKNGDFIVVGKYKELKDKKTWAWIIRYSPEGKVKWEKIYEDKNFDCKYSIFFDIKEDTNGDLICAGGLWDRYGEWNNAEHMWLVRLDSMGCFEPGCGTKDTLHLIYTESDYYTTSTGEVIKDYSYNKGVIIYPNPAHDKINIDFSTAYIAKRWEIYDINSKSVMTGSGDNVKTIDISTLDSGVYLIDFENIDHKKVVGKFVVE